jgi:hypothetical protein
MRGSPQDHNRVVPGRIRKVILSDVNQVVEDFIFIQNGAYPACRIIMDVL